MNQIKLKQRITYSICEICNYISSLSNLDINDIIPTAIADDKSFSPLLKINRFMIGFSPLSKSKEKICPKYMEYSIIDILESMIKTYHYGWMIKSIETNIDEIPNNIRHRYYLGTFSVNIVSKDT